MPASSQLAVLAMPSHTPAHTNQAGAAGVGTSDWRGLSHRSGFPRMRLGARSRLPGVSLLGGAYKLEFGHSRGVAERMDDAVTESGSEFCRLGCVPGGQKTLFAPDLLPDCGERVSEGGPLLAVPSGR
jgi:hypothetical protein